MATDWLFYWMTLPTGLLVIAFSIAAPFVFWRLLLGKSYKKIGFPPLAIGYAGAALGLTVLTFVSSFVEFDKRVASGLLQESQRWPVVRGWTIYTSVISLIFVLPILGLIGVPSAALLLKFRRLTVINIAMASLAFYLLLSVVLWAFESNEWSRANRTEYFTQLLKELLPGVALIGLPFFLGIYATSTSARRAMIETD